MANYKVYVDDANGVREYKLFGIDKVRYEQNYVKFQMKGRSGYENVMVTTLNSLSSCINMAHFNNEDE